jgi:hypothetical protein
VCLDRYKDRLKCGVFVIDATGVEPYSEMLLYFSFALLSDLIVMVFSISTKHSSWCDAEVYKNYCTYMRMEGV